MNSTSLYPCAPGCWLRQSAVVILVVAQSVLSFWTSAAAEDTLPQGFRYRNSYTGETNATSVPACSGNGTFTQHWPSSKSFSDVEPEAQSYYGVIPAAQFGICFGALSDHEYIWIDVYCPDAAVRFHVNSDHYVCRFRTTCAVGTTRNPVTGQCDASQENNGRGQCVIQAGNPINVGVGNKWAKERDRDAQNFTGIGFERFYNSTPYLAGSAAPMGEHWRHGFQRRIDLDSATGLWLNALRPDGKTYRFVYTQNYWLPDGSNYEYGELQWLPEADVTDRLVRLDSADPVPNGWQYTTPDGVTETYDATGRVLEIIELAGNTQTLNCDGNGRLDTVVANTGESLQFGYDAADRISTITDLAGRTWTYRYDANGNLSSVDNPDGTAKQYHYNEPAHTANTDLPHALTGITDERGIRYATFAYQADGRAVATYHAGDAGRVDISYDDTNGTRTVTDSLGHASTYSTAVQLGVALVTGIDGPGCTSCGGSDTDYLYDPATNGLLEKTANGTTTKYGNYDVKGQKGCVTEGIDASDSSTGACGFDPAVSPDARRTDYTYDSRFYGKVDTATETSVYQP